MKWNITVISRQIYVAILKIFMGKEVTARRKTMTRVIYLD